MAHRPILGWMRELLDLVVFAAVILTLSYALSRALLPDRVADLERRLEACKAHLQEYEQSLSQGVETED